MCDAEFVGELGKRLQKETSAPQLNEILGLISEAHVDLDTLRKTKIGISVSKLRKHSDMDVAGAAKKLLREWKNLIPEKREIEVKEDSGFWNGKCSEADFITGDKIRDVVRKRVCESLGECFPDIDSRRLCAMAIEMELFTHFTSTTPEYKAKYRDIVFNLRDKNNPELNQQIYSGAIEVERLPCISSEEMASSELKKQRKDIVAFEKDAVRSDWAKESMTGTTDMWRCARCKERKCTYYQMQTRGGDEPMTTFVTCMVCGKRWKMG